MTGQWINARYASRCAGCRGNICNGEQIYLVKNSGAYCRACGNKLHARAIDAIESRRQAYAKAKAMGWNSAPKRPSRKAIAAAIDMYKP